MCECEFMVCVDWYGPCICASVKQTKKSDGGVFSRIPFYFSQLGLRQQLVMSQLLQRESSYFLFPAENHYFRFCTNSFLGLKVQNWVFFAPTGTPTVHPFNSRPFSLQAAAKSHCLPTVTHHYQCPALTLASRPPAVTTSTMSFVLFWSFYVSESVPEF